MDIEIISFLNSVFYFSLFRIKSYTQYNVMIKLNIKKAFGNSNFKGFSFIGESQDTYRREPLDVKFYTATDLISKLVISFGETNSIIDN